MRPISGEQDRFLIARMDDWIRILKSDEPRDLAGDVSSKRIGVSPLGIIGLA